MNEYVVVFDITGEQLSSASLMIFGAVGVAVGLAVAWLTESKVAGYCVAAVFVGVVALALWTNWSQLQQLKQRLRSGEVIVIEGAVTEFRADSERGDSQVFFVNGHRFSVSRLSLSPGFHNTVQAGGPSLENKCVRVLTVTDGTIVWLGMRECSVSEDGAESN